MYDSIRFKTECFSTVKDNPWFEEKRFNYDYDDSHTRRVRKMISQNLKLSQQLENQGKYVPKCWIEQSSFYKGHKYLYLEFSIPKFMHGHNVAVVYEDGVGQLIKKISDFFIMIKVSVSEADIKNAVVTMIAYCQNINVKQFGTGQDVMKILLPFNYRFRSGFEPKYNPDGQLTHIDLGNTSSHFVVYDKLLELIAHAKTIEEKVMLERMLKAAEDVIRFELTLHNKMAIKQWLKKFYPVRDNYTKDNFTLVEVLKDHIGRELLKNEISEIYGHPLNFITVMDNYEYHRLHKEIQDMIEGKFTDTKLKSQIYFMLGIYRSDGEAGVRKYLKKHCPPRTGGRRIRDLKDIQAVGIKLNTPNEKILEYILQQFNIVPSLKPGQQILF